ncbi:glucose-6-phosphate 1-dehydrogenase [compost metagenome]
MELTWKWVQPILNAFAKNSVPLYHYAAGTFGPAESDQLLAENGHHWWLDSAVEEEGELTLPVVSNF